VLAAPRVQGLSNGAINVEEVEHHLPRGATATLAQIIWADPGTCEIRRSAAAIRITSRAWAEIEVTDRIWNFGAAQSSRACAQEGTLRTSEHGNNKQRLGARQRNHRSRCAT
jgi:hypothetical protein